MLLWTVIGILSICWRISKGLEFSDLQQWCNVSSKWEPYNITKSTCFECAEATKLVSKRTKVDNLICCYSGSENVVSSRKDCQNWPRGENGRACNNGNVYLPSEECDFYNHCGDGSDEKTCDVDCSGRFRCSEYQCFPLEKVCDGQKDCLDGNDEMNCIYHAGRCEGYLCSTFKECIEKNKVCNGVKDCLDGSDELGCSLQGPGLFFCNASSRTSQNTTKSQVCDGLEQCGTKLDEARCVTWTPWNLWSVCDCFAFPPLQMRNRECIDSNFAIMPFEKCRGGRTNESQTCDCVTATTTGSVTVTTRQLAGLEVQWIVIISLAAAILVLTALGIVYGAWHSKQAKAAMEKQAAVVANIYNQSTLSLSPPPAIGTTQGFDFAVSNETITRSTTRRQNEPLPLTPIHAFNHTYESVEEMRRVVSSPTIDPYAQSAGSRSSLPGIAEEGDVNDCSYGVETIVETYRTSGHSSSSGNEQYLKTPPPLPTHERRFDKDGYLLPSASKKARGADETNGPSGVAYAAMMRPTKPPRLRHSSQILKPTNNIHDQYATMRSFSADGIFSGPRETLKMGNYMGRSIRLRDKTPAFLMTSTETCEARPMRRARSLGNLTDQTEPEDVISSGNNGEVEYSAMRSPEKFKYAVVKKDREEAQKTNIEEPEEKKEAKDVAKTEETTEDTQKKSGNLADAQKSED